MNNDAEDVHHSGSGASSKSNSASNTPQSSLTKKQIASLGISISIFGNSFSSQPNKRKQDEYIPWKSLLTATGARSLVDAQRFAIRYLFFSTVLQLGEGEHSSSLLRNVDLFDLRNVTRHQTEYFTDVFGEFANVLAACVELSNCYHGAIDGSSSL